MSQAVGDRGATVAQIEHLLSKYAGMPADVDDVRGLLAGRLADVQGVKRELGGVAISDDPMLILKELHRHEKYGNAILEEKGKLQHRVTRLLEQSRAEMEALVRDPAAPIVEMERSLAKYSSYPNDLNDIRGALQAKFESVLDGVRRDINRWLSSPDVTQVAATLGRFTGATSGLAASVVADLEHIKMKLSDQLGRSMSDALLSDDPVSIADLIEKSRVHADSLHTAREALEQRADKLIAKANVELAAGLDINTYEDVEATLAKYERFPADVKQAWMRLDAHKTKLMRDVVAEAQQAMRSTFTADIDRMNRKLSSFGDRFSTYKHLLMVRRRKLVEMANKTLGEAAAIDDVVEVDRLASAHVHLAAEIPGQTWRALRDHRERLMAELREEVGSALKSSSIVKLDQLVGKCSRDGLRAELGDELDQLAEHRAYLLEEAETATASARQASSSMSYSVVASKLEELVEFGLGDRAEAAKLAGRKAALLQAAKSELAAAASSANAHLIGSVLAKHAALGSEADTERAALKVCLRRLEGSCRTALEAALDSVDTQAVHEALVQSSWFEPALGELRAAVRARAAELASKGRVELEAAVESDDLGQLLGVVERNRGVGGELQPLHAKVAARLEQTVSSSRAAILEALQVGRPRTATLAATHNSRPLTVVALAGRSTSRSGSTRSRQRLPSSVGRGRRQRSVGTGPHCRATTAGC